MMKEFKKLLDCLNRQICELENLCRLKDARIAELEKRLAESEGKGITSTWPFRGWSAQEACQHDYPSPWMATVPPHCKKCGQQAQSVQVTCSGDSSESQWR